MQGAGDGFKLIENQLQFKTLEQGQVDGVKLSEQEQEYLLPHFLMLLVGKPGSGKTTLLKQLLTNNQMYYRKFDDVILVSPSHAKMGVRVKQENTNPQFDLDWIFDKFDKINRDQLDHVFGHKLKLIAKEKKSETGKSLGKNTVLNDNKSRWLLGDMFRPLPSQIKAIEDGGVKKGRGKQNSTAQAPASKRKQEVDASEIFMQKKYEELKKLPRDEQDRTHRNILLVLDDVVGSIKKAEYDPRLAQLAMNRRHIIFNGTISIIIVTQKYSLVPSRVRSNANWLILYKLNPVDFEAAYRDAIVLSPQRWRQLLDFAYGTTEYSDTKGKGKMLMQDKDYGQEDGNDYDDGDDEPVQEFRSIKDEMKGKKYENLGVWVEMNIYFKNFKRIHL